MYRSGHSLSSGCCRRNSRTSHGWILIAAIIILAGCDAEVPFNISVLPFLASVARQGVYEPEMAAVTIQASDSVAPDFQIERLPLNDLQIPFELTTPMETDRIVSAVVEVGLSSSIVPDSSEIDVTGQAEVALYVAPAGTQDRFVAAYRVPLGPMVLGTGSESLLQGELTESQVVALRSGQLLLGMEFSQTLVTILNQGGAVYSFEGFAWEITELRFRGSVTL